MLTWVRYSIGNDDSPFPAKQLSNKVDF
jgi:hypothetical protein